MCGVRLGSGRAWLGRNGATFPPPQGSALEPSLRGQGDTQDDQGPAGQLPALHLQHHQQRKPTVVLTGGFQMDQSPGPAGSIPWHHIGTRRGIAAGPAVSAATRPLLDCSAAAARCSSDSCGRLKSPNQIRPREAGTHSPLQTTPRLTLARDCFDSSHQTAEITALSGDGRRRAASCAKEPRHVSGSCCP